MTAVTVQIADSRKRVRNLSINGMIKPSGLRCARITNDKGQTYTTRVRPDGTGDCTCDSRKPCYHMKALLQADLPTFEQLTAISIEEAMTEANEQMTAFVRQSAAKVRCIGCGGTCGEGKADRCKPDRCFWNGWVIREVA